MPLLSALSGQQLQPRNRRLALVCAPHYNLGRASVVGTELRDLSRGSSVESPSLGRYTPRLFNAVHQCHNSV